jgi:hypothetical protein
VGKLYIRGEYLGTERNVYELFWGISAFLLGKSKSPKKGLVNPSFLIGTVREEGRDEEKFRAFKIGSCLSLFKIFISSVIISSISNSKMF